MKPFAKHLLTSAMGNPTINSLLVGLGAGMVLISITSQEPIHAFTSFFGGPFSSPFFIGNWLSLSIPYILTGLAASVSFSVSSFNLGLEGQVYVGAFIGSWVGLQWGGQHEWLGIVLALAAAFLCGGLIAFLSSWWKRTRGFSEMISSFMVGYILILVIDHFLEGPMRDPVSGLISTRFVTEGFRFSRIFPPSDLHSGLWISLGTAVTLFFLLRFTSGGYALRMVGKNRTFARYGGISVQRVLFWGMILSGGMASLAGVVDVFGVHGRMIRGFSAGYGWNGIAIALIARTHPIGVIPSALLFAWLDIGAQYASMMSDITPEIARMIQGIIFYGITAQSLFRWFQFRKREGEA
jgi:simple sugar transport system permease protein